MIIPTPTPSVRPGYFQIADELDRLGATVVSSAGLLSREVKAQLGGLDADDPADRLIEEYEDRLQQVRAEAGRKVAAAFDRVDERTDQIGDGLHGEDRLRLQRLLDEGRAALADGDLIRADASSREAAAFLDERVVPEWRSNQGEPALVEHLVSYLRQSVRFTEVDIRRLHISLKTKPFVILAGLTGTGKSTIGRLYAEALDATTENGRFRRVVVRPNWVDETEVLGYLNPTTNRFEPGWLSALIRTCHRDPDLPVFCVLDEMNLAPVEQYLADVLSAMEEQRTSTAGVPIQLYSPAATPTNAQEWPASILFPDNLFLLGTVNVDETTRPLSDRVLDRANVLQLSSSIDGSHHESLRAEAVREPRWRVRMGEWASIVQAEPFSGHHEFLIEVGEVLTTMRIGLGIRSHLEIERFCANSRDVLGEEAALDHALLQRVIPKVRGFKADLAAGLAELLELLQGVGAESCARVVEDWLDPALGDDAYLDGTAATVGLAAHS